MTRIAIAGICKIARDQHIPSIAANPDLDFVAAVIGHHVPGGIPGFRTLSR